MEEQRHQLSAEEAEARREYYRRWRENHKDQLAEYRKKFWNRKAEENKKNN